MDAALAQIDKISVYKGLSPKNTITLRLLTEEVLAMMHTIAGGVNGEFWIEDQDGVYELHLLVRSPAGFAGGAPQMYESYTWSMEDYRDQLRQRQELDQRSSQEEWDELEKSVVANLADDV